MNKMPVQMLLHLFLFLNDFLQIINEEINGTPSSHDPDVYYGLIGYKFFTDVRQTVGLQDFIRLFSQYHQEWYQNGQRHRNDGPALEYTNGDKVWYRNGQYHRDDGPAAEYDNGNKYWYQNGEHHRDDGPAIDYANGTKVWYQNGWPHRVDCPAVEYINGTKEWWQNGKRYK